MLLKHVQAQSVVRNTKQWNMFCENAHLYINTNTHEGGIKGTTILTSLSRIEKLMYTIKAPENNKEYYIMCINDMVTPSK